MGGFSIYASPAIIAFAIKLIIVSSWLSPTKRLGVSKQLMVLIAALGLLNLSEASFFWARGLDLKEPPFGLSYFICAVWMLSFLVHFCISEFSKRKLIPYVTYAYAAALTVGLLLKVVVDGYVPWKYAYTKVPGDYYWAFEVFTLGTLLTALLVLIRNSYSAKLSSKLRLKARWLLFGFSLSFLAIPFIIIAQRYFSSPINTLITLPITFTAMVVIFVYAHLAHNLVSIPLPFSRDHKAQKHNRNILSLVAITLEQTNSSRLALSMLQQHSILLARSGFSQEFAATQTTRDLLHTKECSKALVSVVEKINKCADSKIIYLGFNISSNKEYRLLPQKK